MSQTKLKKGEDSFTAFVLGGGETEKNRTRARNPYGSKDLSSLELMVGQNESPTLDTESSHRIDVHPSPDTLYLELSERQDSDMSDSDNQTGRQLEFFCVDHMQLCSSKTAAEAHRSCKEIITSRRRMGRISRASTASRNQFGFDGVVRDREEAIKRMYDFAGIFIEERERYRQDLRQSKEECLDSALDFMEDLVTYFMKKKSMFIQKLSQLNQSHINRVDDQVKRCQMVQRERLKTVKYLKELSDILPTSDSNLAYRKGIQEAFQKCILYKEILYREFKTFRRMEYELQFNSEYVSFIKQMDSVGKVVIIDEPSHLPNFLQTPHATPETTVEFEHRELVSVSTLNGRDVGDKGICCFTGCAYVSRKKLLMTDWNNSCLKMFDKHGVLVDRFVTSNCPWDVAQLREDFAAFTCPQEKNVVIVDCDSKMKIESSFRTDPCEPWGIANISGDLAVTCDPWCNLPSVRIYTVRGTILKTICKDDLNRNIFRCPLHIGTDLFDKFLYVSDSSANALLTLTSSGHLYSTYQHPELDYPTGVATDRLNNIYVCGKDSANVHKLTSTGQLEQVMSSSDQEMSSPRAICFEPDGENVAITDTSSSTCNGYLTKVL